MESRLIKMMINQRQEALRGSSAATALMMTKLMSVSEYTAVNRASSVSNLLGL